MYTTPYREKYTALFINRNPVQRLKEERSTINMAEFDKIYDRLGVKFDEVRGEAYYESHLDATVERLVDAGITEKSEGALIVRLDEFGKEVPPCLLRKTDGTTLYATRDLAAAFHRWELYGFERSLYVVGGDQRLHFRQLKHVLERMGMEWEARMEHIDFGMMRLPEGKMSTRKGRVIFLEAVLDEAAAKADKVIAEKNPGLEDRREVAEMVGVGAVIFNDLRRERVKDVEFVWKEVLSFEGDTGPYVQYTHARLASILRKGAAEQAERDSQPEPDWSALGDASPILGKLGRYNAVLSRAARNAEHVHQLAKAVLRVILGQKRLIQFIPNGGRHLKVETGQNDRALRQAGHGLHQQRGGPARPGRASKDHRMLRWIVLPTGDDPGDKLTPPRFCIGAGGGLA